MTKLDIVAQQGNPDYIEDICEAIVTEMKREEFSLRYLKAKANLLQTFIEGLDEV